MSKHGHPPPSLSPSQNLAPAHIEVVQPFRPLAKENPVGLDLYAASHLTPATHVTLEQAEDDEQGRYVWVSVDPAFPASARGLNLPEQEIQDGGFFQGAYAYTDASADFSWRGGSYRGHSIFRGQLAQVAGYTPSGAWEGPGDYAALPFFELIEFSDCEGTIGPEAAADLLADFRAYEKDFAAAYPDSVDLYQNWMKGLSLAADDGLVIFG